MKKNKVPNWVFLIALSHETLIICNCSGLPQKIAKNSTKKLEIVSFGFGSWQESVGTKHTENAEEKGRIWENGERGFNRENY